MQHNNFLFCASSVPNRSQLISTVSVWTFTVCLASRKKGSDENRILKYSAPSSATVGGAPSKDENKKSKLYKYLFSPFPGHQMAMTKHLPFKISYAFKNFKRIEN